MTKYVNRSLMMAITTCIALPIAANAVDSTTGTPISGNYQTPVDGPRLIKRADQQAIVNGELRFNDIRRLGMLMFTSPFNKHDGFGDGDYDPTLPNRSEFSGNRPTLQNNGTFLRVNGLDAQTCLECHTITSNASVPAALGVGGVGGISQNPMPGTAYMDISDSEQNGFARQNGRLINPPFLFGSGGVELVGLEMTQELQDLKAFALENPGTVVTLETKGVHFGSIVADASGNIDHSNIEGIEEDLVVRPFGRKGEFETIRNFDVGATAFHFGMQAVEHFGDNTDQDNDGIFDELTLGDLSVLSIFNTTMDRPFELQLDSSGVNGSELFSAIGCADCHIPTLETSTRLLPYKVTGAPEAPFEDTFYVTDLTENPSNFEENSQGGITVRLFADLKRHDMGDRLAETSDLQSAQFNREFTTARLWGIADTAPYIHDGRALTLREAIEMHDSNGSEASFAAKNFAVLSNQDQIDIIRFLGSLRTPVNPNADVVPSGRQF